MIGRDAPASTPLLRAPSNRAQRLATRLRDKLARRRLAKVVREQPVRPTLKLDKVGSEWGGWSIPSHLIEPDWIAWCVGAGSDVTFDLELLKRGCRVRCVDPFEVFRDQAIAQAGGDERFVFVQAALAHQDGPITMFGRQDIEEGGVSAVNSYRVQTSFTMPGRTLPSLMAEQGDARCDLLKMDIEGSEYDVLDHLDPTALGVRILCVELHAITDAERVRSTMRKLATDYELVRVDDVADLTYLRRDLL